MISAQNPERDARRLCGAGFFNRLKRELAFDPSNLAFSPVFSDQAAARRDALCSGECEICEHRAA